MPDSHARNVFLYVLSFAMLLSGVTIIAWSNRGEADAASARAAGYWALHNAKSLHGSDAHGAYARTHRTSTSTQQDAREQHDLLILDHDRDDARTLALLYEGHAQREQQDASRFALAQVALTIAIVLASLAGPTRRMGWCYLGAIIGFSGLSVAISTFAP
jgi:hypothetical protein